MKKTIGKLSHYSLTVVYHISKTLLILYLGFSVMTTWDWLGEAARGVYCTANSLNEAVDNFVFGRPRPEPLRDPVCRPSVPATDRTSGSFPIRDCNGGTSFNLRLQMLGAYSGNEFRSYAGGGQVRTIAWEPDLVLRIRSGPVGQPDQLTDVSYAGNNHPWRVVEYNVIPDAGVTCQPTGGGVPGTRPPDTIIIPPREIIPPPPNPQVPVNVGFVFFAPIFLPGAISIQIPVTANINFTANVHANFQIPFTLNLPDLTANFDFAFNPYFNLINIEGGLQNWPPPGIRPEKVLEPCPSVELPKPIFKIEERIVGAYVLLAQSGTLGGRTRVPRGSSWFDESIYPRIGHVQFISAKNGYARNTGIPVTERLGYIPNPDPYGADSVQFDPEPGVTGFSAYGVRKPVAVPVKEDGTSPVQFDPVTVI